MEIRIKGLDKLKIRMDYENNELVIEDQPRFKGGIVGGPISQGALKDLGEQSPNIVTTYQGVPVPPGISLESMMGKPKNMEDMLKEHESLAKVTTAWCPTCGKAINLPEEKLKDMHDCKRCGNGFRPSMYLRSPTNEPLPQSAPHFARRGWQEEMVSVEDALNRWAVSCDNCQHPLTFVVKKGAASPQMIRCDCGKVHETQKLYERVVKA